MTLGERIDDVTLDPSNRLLRSFFDGKGPFAGVTFDEMGANDPYQIGPSDLVAVSLLDVRFEPRAVRGILERDAADLSEMLAEIPFEVDLWEADDADLNAALTLHEALDRYAGVGETKASKLLARKRPRLIPVIDSVVRRGLPLGDNPAKDLREALAIESRRHAIELLRPSNLSSRISTLRLLDAAVWMRFSQSRNAKRARESVGLC